MTRLSVATFNVNRNFLMFGVPNKGMKFYLAKAINVVGVFNTDFIIDLAVNEIDL